MVVVLAFLGALVVGQVGWLLVGKADDWSLRRQGRPNRPDGDRGGSARRLSASYRALPPWLLVMVGATMLVLGLVLGQSLLSRGSLPTLGTLVILMGIGLWNKRRRGWRPDTSASPRGSLGTRQP